MATENGNLKGLEILGRRGIIGVMLGLLLLTGGVIYLNYKLSSNHISHSTAVLVELTEVVRASSETNKDLAEAVTELRYSIPQLKSPQF